MLVIQESTTFLGLLNHEDEGAMIIQNVGNYLPNYKELDPRKLKIVTSRFLSLIPSTLHSHIHSSFPLIVLIMTESLNLTQTTRNQLSENIYVAY